MNEPVRRMLTSCLVIVVTAGLFLSQLFIIGAVLLISGSPIRGL